MDFSQRTSLEHQIQMNSSERSSLGILNLENLTDLSSSFLQCDSQGVNPAMGISGTDQQRSMGMSDPARAGVDPGARGWNQPVNSSTSVVPGLNMLPPQTTTGRLIPPTEGTSSSHSVPDKTSIPMMLFGSPGDVDQSIHEVKIDDADLQLLEEEFSDLDDFSIYNNDDQQEFNGDDYGDHGNFQNNVQIPDDSDSMRSFTMNEEWSLRPSIDDIRLTTGQSLEVANQRGSQYDRCYDDRNPVSEDFRGGHSYQARGKGGEFQGEGQEDEEYSQSLSVPTALDSMFLRESPYHGEGDGEMFLSGARMQGSGLNSLESSELDTEDELELLRKDTEQREEPDFPPMQADIAMITRQEAVGQSLYISRPGLEGGNVSGSDNGRGVTEVRQGADGDVVSSPVPGDGGGGGDGSSGHSSDDDGALSPPSNNQNAQTTYDILRGLGFLQPRLHDPLEEDNPEAQQRIQPMGDDLSETDIPNQQGPHFPPTAEIRSRLLSGASFEQDQGVNSQQNHTNNSEELTSAEDSRLASMFLQPSAPFSQTASIVNDPQTGWTLDQSSLHPEDIMDSGSCEKNDRDCGGMEDREWGPGDYIPGDEDGPVFNLTKPQGRHEFSQLEPSGSPGSRRSSEGRVSGKSNDSRFSARSSEGRHSTEKVSTQTSKNSASLDSPVVFVDASGDVVTDLAFHTSFDAMASEQMGLFNEEFDNGELNLSDQDENFMCAEDGRAFLNEDEHNFVAENMFAETDAMEDLPAPGSDNSSWTYQNSLQMTRPSFMEDVSQLRISIGAFMGSRTEALGSLDGDPDAPRPDFGTQILTPPDNRRPITLFRLSDIQETGMPGDEVRGSGVGSDVEGDNTFQKDDFDSKELGQGDVGQFISPTSEGSTRNNGKESLDSQQSTLRNTLKQAETPELKISDLQGDKSSAVLCKLSDPKMSLKYGEGTLTNKNVKRLLENEVQPTSPVLGKVGDESIMSPGNNTTLGNRTGILHVSTISKLISDVSLSANPEELADIILKMSNAKASQKSKVRDVNSNFTTKEMIKKTSEVTSNVQREVPLDDFSVGKTVNGIQKSSTDATSNRKTSKLASSSRSSSNSSDMNPSSNKPLPDPTKDFPQFLSQFDTIKQSLSTTIRPPRRINSDPQTVKQQTSNQVPSSDEKLTGNKSSLAASIKHSKSATPPADINVQVKQGSVMQSQKHASSEGRRYQQSQGSYHSQLSGIDRTSDQFKNTDVAVHKLSSSSAKVCPVSDGLYAEERLKKLASQNINNNSKTRSSEGFGPTQTVNQIVDHSKTTTQGHSSNQSQQFTPFSNQPQVAKHSSVPSQPDGYLSTQPKPSGRDRSSTDATSRRKDSKDSDRSSLSSGNNRRPCERESSESAKSRSSTTSVHSRKSNADRKSGEKIPRTGASENKQERAKPQQPRPSQQASTQRDQLSENRQDRQSQGKTADSGPESMKIDVDIHAEGEGEDEWGTPRRSMMGSHAGFPEQSFPDSKQLVAEFEASVRKLTPAQEDKAQDKQNVRSAGSHLSNSLSQKQKNESTPPVARKFGNIRDADRNDNKAVPGGNFRQQNLQSNQRNISRDRQEADPTKELAKASTLTPEEDYVTPRDTKQMLSHKPCLASTPYVKDFLDEKHELDSPSHILPPSHDASACHIISSTDTSPRKVTSVENTPKCTSNQGVIIPRRLTGVDSTPNQFVPSLSSTTAETPDNAAHHHGHRQESNENRGKMELGHFPSSREDNARIRESTESIVSGHLGDSHFSKTNTVPSFQHNLIPSRGPASLTSTTTPTLLTSQPLSKTAFAAEYLSGRSSGYSVLRTSNTSPSASEFYHISHSITPAPSSQPAHVTSDRSSSNKSNRRSAGAPSATYQQRQEPKYLSYPPSSYTSVMTNVTPTSLQSGCVVSTSVSGRLALTDSNLHQRGLLQTGQSGEFNFTAPVPLTPILEAPTELRIPGICCVDLSCHAQLPIHNPTSRWLQASLRLVGLSVDGDDRDPDKSVPFILKEKVIIEPHTTQDVKVIFAPKHAGVYVANLHVLANSLVADKPVEQERLPTMVTIQALAELPSVQIYTDSGQTLDFGQVPWGSQKVMTFNMINRGRCTVPVRLAISSKSVWSCFAFERQSFSDVSIISGTSLSAVPSLANTVANYVLPGRDRDEDQSEPLTVTVHFKAPHKLHDRAHAQLPPEEFRAHIDVEVDTPTAPPVLGSVQLRAEAGVVRLHTLQTMETVKLKAQPGQSMSLVLPLRNAGNITLNVMLDVTDWQDVYTVLPSRLTIAPHQEAEVIIKFEPKDRTRFMYESFLVMSVDPDGPAFEITLQGELGSLPPPQPAVPRVMPILSNKMYLAWGGVALGRALQQSLTLRNNSEQMLKLKLQLRANTHDFQLQSIFGHQKKLSDSKEIILQPKEDYPVSIVFAPTRVAAFTSKLSISHNQGSTKYSIPLSGYGGTSHLVMEGLKAGQKNTYWTSVGEVKPNKSIVCKLVVKNTGSRAAFIKALAFTDLSCKNKVVAGRVTVQPSEFCLKKEESRTVVAMVNPTEMEAAMCQDKANMIGVVMFLYGDEVSRQIYRRAVQSKRFSFVELADENPLKKVNFDVQYGDEHLVNENLQMKQTNSDMEIFFANISRLLVALVGDRSYASTAVPPPEVNGGMTSVHHSSLVEKTLAGSLKISKQTVPNSNQNKTDPGSGRGNLRTVLSSPPVKGTPAPHHTLAGYSKVMKTVLSDDSQLWTIKPNQIIVPAPKINSEENVRKIQICNFSDRVIQYDLVWPGHCLQVTPERGSIGPRSLTTVCVSACSSLYSKGVHLPWSGQVVVMCEGQNQILKVQIREDISMDDSIYPSSRALYPLMSQLDTPPLSIATTVIPVVVVTNQDVKFPATECKQTTESFVQLKNTSSEVVTWSISSFAPAYVQKSEEGKEVYRVTYAVFRFPVRMGSLQPYEEIKVLVSFSPQDAGLYSQCWEMETQKPESASQTCRIQLSAQGIPGKAQTDNLSIMETGQQEKSSHRHQTRKSAKKANLPVKDTFSDTQKRRPSTDNTTAISVPSDLLTFPVTAPRKTSICKLEIKNNSPSVCVVEVISPQPPFHVKHSKLKLNGMFYVRCPVEFRPKKPGSYESLLVLRYDMGHSLGIHLKGQCS